MTLDDFLSALENLIEDQETSDDDPGEGNFGCEECRACNHCRFCIGCDSCEDCTYCDECIDTTSCTQSKRCVSCEKVSYCEDCRDCKASRYLTLCIDCTDCVHCLACVGISGGEFYVLNEKRTRKEYFSLLRQVQELMRDRMVAGWRPPGIGLASDIIDAVTANRDSELSAAPWLNELDTSFDRLDAAPPGRDRLDPDHLDRDPLDPDLRYDRDPLVEHEDERFEPRGQPRPSRTERPPAYGRDLQDERSGRAPPSRRYEDERPAPRGEHRRPAAYERDPARDDSDWMSSPPEFGSSYKDPPSEDLTRPVADYERSEASWSRPRQDYGRDLGRDLSQDNSAQWSEAELDRGDAHNEGRERDYGRGRGDDHRERGRPEREHGRSLEREPDDSDVPQMRDQLATRPFTRRGAELGRQDEASPEPRVWDDSRERTVARDRAGSAEPQDPSVEPREHEPSSPWLEDNPAQARRRAKRGSLRRAGRPTRPPPGSEAEPGPEVTGTGSYRTGSAPERSSPRRGRADHAGSEGTHTGGTGLRLGRKPKRR